MRLSLKARQVAAVTSIVGAAVVVLGGLYVTGVARVRLEESRARGRFLANAIYHRTREVVAGSADPYAALRADPGLRSVLESAYYSPDVSYAAIVDALDKHGGRVDYGAVFDDVRKSIDEAHRDGDFYATVTRDLPKYVQRDDDLEATLHKFRSAGKKLFLLTNSPWSYTDTMMSYLFGSRRKEYPTWRHYFDAVVVAAQKPNWFREGRSLMERDRDMLRDVSGKIDRGRIYEGGNLAEFERLLGIRGSSVLYVGDHIYGDILRSKKESSWHTAMIIPELDAEIDAEQALLDADEDDDSAIGDEDGPY